MTDKKMNQVQSNEKDTLDFEPVYGKENVVKAVSYNDEGKKHEVYVYVISEAQFAELIPSSEKVEMD